MAAVLLSAILGITANSCQGVTNQHGQGGGLFVEDDVVMGWLLGK